MKYSLEFHLLRLPVCHHHLNSPSIQFEPPNVSLLSLEASSCPSIPIGSFRPSPCSIHRLSCPPLASPHVWLISPCLERKAHQTIEEQSRVGKPLHIWHRFISVVQKTTSDSILAPYSSLLVRWSTLETFLLWSARACAVWVNFKSIPKWVLAKLFQVRLLLQFWGLMFCSIGRCTSIYFRICCTQLKSSLRVRRNIGQVLSFLFQIQWLMCVFKRC